MTTKMSNNPELFAPLMDEPCTCCGAMPGEACEPGCGWAPEIHNDLEQFARFLHLVAAALVADDVDAETWHVDCYMSWGW